MDANVFTNGFKVADDGDVYVAPKNEIVNISELWAFLSVDKSDNTEGVISMVTEAGAMPLIAADAARLIALEPRVEKIVRDTGITVRLVKFTKREHIRTIERKP